ncbi:MAG: TRAP transporter small permease [Chloroflexota bacterium]
MAERALDVAVTRTPERSSFLSRVNKGVAALERWLNYAGVAVLAGLMVMTVIQVASRYLFRRPMQGYIDYMEMMMVVLVALGIAYCQQQKGHVRMELFMDRVLKGGRSYNLVEFFHLLISLAGFGLIAYYSSIWAWSAYTGSDVTQTVLFPTWPAKSALAVGSILLSIRLLLQMVQSTIRVLVGGKKPATTLVVGEE